MVNVTRIFDIPRRQKEKFAASKSLVGKINGDWKAWSTDEFIDNANLITKGLLTIGIEKGDAVAMIAANRPEWNILDLSLIHI